MLVPAVLVLAELVLEVRTIAERYAMRRLGGATTLAIVMLGAAALSYAAGRRGLFAFDQSPFFDGAYRLVRGQVPYRDFVTPMGVPAFAIQALFFQIVGVGWRAMLIAAAVANAAAVLVVFAIVSRVADRFWVALVSAALTGLWFYPHWGTTNDVQTAFLFLLFALLVAVCAPAGCDRRAGGWLALAGALTFGIALSKQSVGLYSLPLITLVVMAPAFEVRARRWREAIARLGWAAIGGIGAATLFGIWLVRFSDPATFWHHAVRIPLGVGLGRLGGSAAESAVLGVAMPFFLHLVLGAAVVIGLLEFILPTTNDIPRGRKVGLMLMGAVAFEYLFVAKTLNHWSNGLPLIGILVGLTFDRALLRCQRSTGGLRRVMTVGVVTSFASVGLLLALAAWNTALGRAVHEGVAGASFVETVDVPGLSSVRWASPTRVGFQGATVDASTMAALYEDLDRRDRPFFVFPDFTFLYGLLGQEPPQPWVWFQPGMTYRPEPDPTRDRRIIQSLTAAGIEIVVIERESFFGWRLGSFPDLDRWIQAHFEPVRTIGIFMILERRRSDT